MNTIILLLALFGIKHFICDFLLQTDKMLKEKGTYGADGGQYHAYVHALGTLAVLLIALPWAIKDLKFAAGLAAFDGMIHYHIDYVKTRLSRGLTPADKLYWVYFGADQGLHYLTYIAIIAIVVL